MEYHPVYICRRSQECVVASSHDSRSRPLYLSLKDSSDHGLSRPRQAPTTSLSSNDSRTAKSTSRMARHSTSLAVPKSSLTTSSRTTSALLPSPLRRPFTGSTRNTAERVQPLEHRPEKATKLVPLQVAPLSARDAPSRAPPARSANVSPGHSKHTGSTLLDCSRSVLDGARKRCSRARAVVETAFTSFLSFYQSSL